MFIKHVTRRAKHKRRLMTTTGTNLFASVVLLIDGLNTKISDLTTYKILKRFNVLYFDT